ncbi:hypothetical protein DRN52_08500 [Thermococci archaeon]|nr:MAG: hypothetical protein DRN52_08500 [Thermococci archaeon]
MKLFQKSLMKFITMVIQKENISMLEAGQVLWTFLILHQVLILLPQLYRLQKLIQGSLMKISGMPE